MFHQYRFVLVIAILVVAIALLTEKGKLPLALRGMKRVLQRDAGTPDQQASQTHVGVPTWKRLLAFVLVLVALVIAVV